MELEARPTPALMLKEWLELEFIAELSRDGFGCYPRHLVATRRNGDVISRVSAAVRAALFRLPSGREGEVALSGNSSRRPRMGFWKKPMRDEVVDRRSRSCSASTTSSGRRDSRASAKSSRRRSWERVLSGGAGRRNHDTEVRLHSSLENSSNSPHVRLDRFLRNFSSSLPGLSSSCFATDRAIPLSAIDNNRLRRSRQRATWIRSKNGSSV
jgi:hypothetical protein